MTRLFDRSWRTFATGFSFFIFSCGALTLGLLFLPCQLMPLGSQRKQQWLRSSIRNTCRFYIKMMRILGLLDYDMQLDIGDARGQLIIANHPSLLDAIFLLAGLENICCIVKEELWQNPFTVITVTQAGYIPNNSTELVELAAEKLAAGDNVLIFPEGTRNRYNDQLDFKRGAANIAVVAQCPITPVVIHCEPRTLQKGDRWYDIPEKPPLFQLHAQPSLDIEQCIDTSRPRTVQYRHLTQFLREYYRPFLSPKNQRT